MSEPPRKIGPYLLDRRLGRGGMGEVWRAAHPESGAIVAIKFARLKERGYEARIAREARVQANLDSPNIVRILDVLESGGSTSIVMEFIDGKSLYEVLRRDTLTDAERDDIVVGLFRGLGFAHGAGVLHRDLKPSNIMMAREGERWVPKLADFGLAREIHQGATSGAPLTQSGIILGTPGYMAPEQIRAAKSVDERADVFALGCVLYQLYTGERAFRGADPFEVMRRSCDGDFRCPDEIQPDLPGRVVDAIEAALAPLRERRPNDVETLEQIWKGERSSEGYGRIERSARAQGLSDVDSEQVTELAKSQQATDRSPVAPLGRGGESARPLGRDQETREVVQLLKEGALVTLLGPGGIGKTRLAKWIGLYSGLVDVAEAHFCDLTEATTPAGVFGQVAAALDVPLFDENVEAQLARVISGRGETLIILDNAEQVTGVLAPTLRGWMKAAPKARFLVTSRIALGLEREQLFEVPTLATDAAALLFERRARREQPRLAFSDEDRPIIRQIVERVDCMPLAIELAAPRAALLPLEQLLERLDDRFRVLQRDAPDKPARALSMRAAIDGSWNLLRPWEKLGLVQASVFRGGFDLEAAESVLSLDHWPDAPWVMDVLHSLVRQSLLRVQNEAHGQRRLGLYESIREYAAEKMAAESTGLSESGEPLYGPAALRSLERRHAEYYAFKGSELCDAAIRVSTARVAGDRLIRERENLAASLDNAVAQDANALAASCAHALAQSCGSRGPISQGIAWLNQAIEVETLDDSTYAQLVVEKYALSQLIRQSDFDDAHRLLALPETDSLRNSKVLVLNYMLMCSYGTPKFRPWVEEELTKRMPLTTDADVRAVVLHSAAHRALRNGEIQKGIELGTQARQLQEGNDNILFLIRNKNGLGACYMHSGHIDQATACRKEALTLAKTVGEESLIAVMELNLGWHAYLQEDYGLAEKHGLTALRISTRIGAFRTYCLSLANLAMVYLSRRDWDSAIEALRKAKKAADSANFHMGRAVRRRLALALGRSGQIAEAWVELDCAEEGQNAQGAVESVKERLVQAELEFRAGDVDAAKATLEGVDAQVQEHDLGRIPDVIAFLKMVRSIVRDSGS